MVTSRAMADETKIETNILLIEDDPAIAESLSEGLGRERLQGALGIDRHGRCRLCS